MSTHFGRRLFQTGIVACLYTALIAPPAQASFDLELYAPFTELQESIEEAASIYDNYYGMPGMDPDSPLPDAMIPKVQGAVATLLADYENVKSKMIGRLPADKGRQCRAGFGKIDSDVLPLIKAQSQDAAKIAKGHSNGFLNLLRGMTFVVADFVPDCVVSAQFK